MPKSSPKVYWSSDKGEAKLYQGDAIDVLSRLPAESVQCVVTSPPYWGLRDYGVSGQLGSETSPDCGTHGQAQCGQCFVCSMMGVFREVRRVLRDDGTLWLNLGDTYANTGACGGGSPVGQRDYREADRKRQQDMNRVRSNYGGLTAGNLVGVPWRIALALQADGWVLRQDIIWHKPSPMPESATNRCTKSHEYLFLLAKRDGYYFDHHAISEPAKSQPDPKDRYSRKLRLLRRNEADFKQQRGTKVMANKRSVWTIASAPYKGAHFATFPPDLVEPCVLAGTSEFGRCDDCGKPYTRTTDEDKVVRNRPNEYVKRTGEPGTGNSCSNSAAGTTVKTIGWSKQCDCSCMTVKPCVVLDPFAGSGTTLAVATYHGRHALGIELNEDYIKDQAIKRVAKGVWEKSAKMPGLKPKL